MGEVRMKLDSVKEGEIFKGYYVSKKYFFDNEKPFIIFKDDKDNVVYFAEKQISNISDLIGQCELLKIISHGSKTKEWIDFQKALALNEFYNDNEERSKDILEKCIDRIIQKEATRKKLFYIGAYLLYTIIVVMLFAISYYCFEAEIKKYFEVVIFGAFGGFISLNTKLDRIEFNLNESTTSFFLVSLYKFIFSIVCSIVALSLIDSGVILYHLKDERGVINVVAALAGFSESFLPNIFGGIEKNIEGNEGDK